MPAISVIVPIFNVENYVRKCVDSILNQTFSDIEIILVDDGSTDASGRICDEYLSKDDRIRVIHKENGGLSDARNAGLDMCTGEYIGFVDGDDYIDGDMYELLYNNIIKYDADISMCKYRRIYTNKIADNGRNEIWWTNKKSVAIKELYCGDIGISVCSKLYRRAVFSGTYFIKGKTSEDVYITIKTILNAEKFIFDYRTKYNYIERLNSITMQSKYKNNIIDVVDAYNYNHDIICVCFPEIVEVSEYRLWWAYKTAIERILNCRDYIAHLDEVNALQGIIRSNLLYILKNKYLNWRQRISYILLCIDVNIYWRIKNIVNG